MQPHLGHTAPPSQERSLSRLASSAVKQLQSAGEHGHSFNVCWSGANNTLPNRIYCFHPVPYGNVVSLGSRVVANLYDPTESLSAHECIVTLFVATFNLSTQPSSLICKGCECRT